MNLPRFVHVLNKCDLRLLYLPHISEKAFIIFLPMGLLQIIDRPLQAIQHPLALKDYTPEEITYLLDLAADLKEKKKNGVPVDKYRGMNVALIFEKTSTRTRCSAWPPPPACP